MPTKKIAFRCYHPDCAGEQPTELIIEIPARRGTVSGQKQKLVYCHRNHANLLNLPADWDAHPPTLGDEGFLGYRQDVPLFQGRQP